MSKKSAVTKLECVKCGTRENLKAMYFSELKSQLYDFSRFYTFYVPVCVNCKNLFEKYVSTRDTSNMVELITLFSALLIINPVFFNFWIFCIYFLFCLVDGALGIFSRVVLRILKGSDRPSKYVKFKLRKGPVVRTNGKGGWVPFEIWKLKTLQEKKKLAESLHFDEKKPQTEAFEIDEKANIRHLIREREDEITRIEEEANLKYESLEQEVDKEYDPKIKELKSYLVNNSDRDAVKNYKSQIKNLTKEKEIKFNTGVRNIYKDKKVKIKRNFREIKGLWKKGVVLEKERKRNTIKEKKMPK